MLCMFVCVFFLFIFFQVQKLLSKVLWSKEMVMATQNAAINPSEKSDFFSQSHKDRYQQYCFFFPVFFPFLLNFYIFKNIHIIFKSFLHPNFSLDLSLTR